MKLFLLIFLMVQISLVLAVKCNFDDENLGACVRDVINENFSKLHNPNKNALFDTIDPYFFEFGDVIFNGTGTQLAKGTFTILNTTVVGAKNIIVKTAAVEKDEDKMSILGDLQVSLASADGFFDSNLSISELIFVTKGKFKGVFEKSNGKFNISGIVENNNFRVNDFDIKVVIDNATFNLTGIAKDKTLNLIITEIVNEGWKLVYQQLIAQTKYLWSPIIVQLLNELFKNVLFQ